LVERESDHSFGGDGIAAFTGSLRAAATRTYSVASDAGTCSPCGEPSATASARRVASAGGVPEVLVQSPTLSASYTAGEKGNESKSATW